MNYSQEKNKFRELFLFTLIIFMNVFGGEDNQEKTVTITKTNTNEDELCEVIETVESDYLVFTQSIWWADKKWDDFKLIAEEKGHLFSVAVFNDTLNYIVAEMKRTVWKKVNLKAIKPPYLFKVLPSVNSKHNYHLKQIVSNNEVAYLAQDISFLIYFDSCFQNDSIIHERYDHFGICKIDNSTHKLFYISFGKKGDREFFINELIGNSIRSISVGSMTDSLGLYPSNTMQYFTTDGEYFLKRCINCNGINYISELDRINYLFKSNAINGDTTLYRTKLPRDSMGLISISKKYLYYYKLNEDGKNKIIRVKAVPRKLIDGKWEICK